MRKVILSLAVLCTMFFASDANATGFLSRLRANRQKNVEKVVVERVVVREKVKFVEVEPVRVEKIIVERVNVRHDNGNRANVRARARLSY